MSGSSSPIDILTNAFGGVKVAWRSGDKYLLHAPHREDTKPSFYVYRARNGNWRVRDYATGVDEWLDDFIRTHVGQEIKVQQSKPRVEQPKSDEPKLDEVIGRLGLLRHSNWTYQDHGFFRARPPQYVTPIQETIHRRLRKGNVALLWKGPDGKPHGVQVRAASASRAMRYWWAVKPTMQVGFSDNWRDAKELVIAEGMFKAQAAAQVLSAHRTAVIQAALEKRGSSKKAPRWTTGYIALTNADAITEVLKYAPLLPRRITILLDADVANAIRHYDTTKDMRHRATRWLRAISALMLAGFNVKVYEQRNGDINDALARGGLQAAARWLEAGRWRNLPRLTPKAIAAITAPANMPEAGAAFWRYMWLAGAELSYDRRRASHTLTAPADFASVMRVSGASRPTVVAWAKQLKSAGQLLAEGTRWALYTRYTATANPEDISSIAWLEDKKLNTLSRAVTIGSTKKPNGSWSVRHLLAWALHSTGSSIAEISRRTGFSRTTVYALLKRAYQFLHGDRMEALWRSFVQAMELYWEYRRMRVEAIFTAAHDPAVERRRRQARERIQAWRRLVAGWYAA